MYLREVRRFLFLSEKFVACLGIGVCVFSLGVLLSFPSWAQFRPRASAPAASQPEVAKDPLGRTTPRGTILAFLSAARNEGGSLPPGYLDTRLRGKAAADSLRASSSLCSIAACPRGSITQRPARGLALRPLQPDQELAGTISSERAMWISFLNGWIGGSPGPCGCSPARPSTRFRIYMRRSLSHR